MRYFSQSSGNILSLLTKGHAGWPFLVTSLPVAVQLRPSWLPWWPWCTCYSLVWHSGNSFLCLWEVHRDAFGWSRSRMLSINPGRLQSRYQMRYPAETEYLTSPLFAMMMSSNGNIFRVTGHLCGEFTGDRWIPRTKASGAELWCFLWSAPE